MGVLTDENDDHVAFPDSFPCLRFPLPALIRLPERTVTYAVAGERFGLSEKIGAELIVFVELETCENPESRHRSSQSWHDYRIRTNLPL